MAYWVVKSISNDDLRKIPTKLITQEFESFYFDRENYINPGELILNDFAELCYKFETYNLSYGNLIPGFSLKERLQN